MRQLLAEAAAADRDRRRQPLVGGGERRADALRRALRHSGRDLVPPHPCDRPAASELCRRSRQRSQSEAARAREGGRPRAADRRPARRMADAGLHAARRAGAEADARSTCIPASRNSAASTVRISPIHATPTAFAAALDQIAAPNDMRWRDETKAAHADYLAFTEKPTAVPGAGQSRRDRRGLARYAAGRCHRHAPAPAISRSGCSASIAIANTARTTRRPPARWAMACRRRSR